MPSWVTTFRISPASVVKAGKSAIGVMNVSGGNLDKVGAKRKARRLVAEENTTEGLTLLKCVEILTVHQTGP